ncbi:MAG TPA: hypothetical protein DCY74_02165 [Clostridiales bacterium]|nr:hypothetical protein [Clostridiales bacterium]HCG34874.1 hypothetical protein [Clostridiales bacterium]
MKQREYLVISIEGDYARIQDQKDHSEIFIAMALLPEGTNLKSRLRWENFTYTLLDSTYARFLPI